MKVYLSASYKDLLEHRKAAYQQLRMMRHDVIGMEDYVAADQRPLDKCLADVAASDIYFGVFAFRYGFVPPRNNPGKLSITELEYREARKLQKPCLVFLSKEDAPWPATMTDFYSGEGGRGEQIRKLRAELAEEHVVSFFATPDQLAGLAAAAVFGVTAGPAIAQQDNLATELTKRRPATGNARPRRVHDKFWLPGSVLRVRFLDRNPDFERKIRRYLPLWSVYANIQFAFSDDVDAEVRVGFREGTNWAYIGTDCMKLPKDQPTMNFGFLDPPEACVLHEFGHVLGLMHEHNHPNGITWNKQAVLDAMARPPNNWDKATTSHTMFATWPKTTFPVAKPFDPGSIMAYPMPRNWTKLEADFGHKDSLSRIDKDFVQKLYPFDA